MHCAPQVLVYPWNLARLRPGSVWLGGALRPCSNASRPLPTFRLSARRDAPPTLLAQEMADNGAASAIAYFASLQAARAASNRTDELHLYRSTGAHGRGACRQQAAAPPNIAQCGTRRTLSAQRSSLRELHPRNYRRAMCEDWPKMALRFMRRLDFVCDSQASSSTVTMFKEG